MSSYQDKSSEIVFWKKLAERYTNPWTVGVQNQTTEEWHECIHDAPLSLACAERRMMDHQTASPEARFKCVPWFNSPQRHAFDKRMAAKSARIAQLEEANMVLVDGHHRIRAAVIEECAGIADDYSNAEFCAEAIAEDIRALKDKP